MTISGTSVAKVTICILLGCCVIMRVTGSAIPMWEFLSRNEKVSTNHHSILLIMPIILFSLVQEIYRFSIILL